MRNDFIQGLYEAASSDIPDENNGLSKFDEQKLRRYLNNSQIGKGNREIFAENESKFHTCPRYNPCPICNKCKSKASHLYKECEMCTINICAHTYKDMCNLIKRKNFVEYVGHDTMELIKQLDEEISRGKQNG